MSAAVNEELYTKTGELSPNTYYNPFLSMTSHL